MAVDRRKLLESAQRYLMKGQIRKAISDYERLVTDDPNNIRIRSKLADLYVRNNDLDRAVGTYIQLAKRYEDEDLNYRAISMCKKVLTLRPGMIDVHYALADLYKKEGLLGNAKVLYQNIIKLNPEDQVARRGISEIDQTLAGVTSLHREGEMAPETPERDLAQDSNVPNEPLILDDIPEMQEPSSEQADTDQEVFELEDPLDLPPGGSVPSLTTDEKTEDSPYFTHQNVILDDDVPPEKDLESHYHLGVAYLEMDLIDQAVEEFEAALSYAPKKIDCLVMLGRCYLQKGVFDRSISYLEEASRSEDLTHEEHVRIYRQLGEVYEACGMKDKAGLAFQRAGVAEEKSPG